MNRSGELVKNLSGDAAYNSFRPADLPPNPKIEIDDFMMRKIINANNKIVELDTSARLIPNVDLFISMYVRKEALISSQIEGTQCTLDDILDPESATTTNLDVSDVVNYIEATNYAIDRLKELPICNRMLRDIHKKLLKGVRGDDKNPGEFRRSQNWIGPANCSLKDARFIPPNVSDMNQGMDALERYINDSSEYDYLVQAALINYQFETIHPFLDGNGRVGRLLILLYLMEKGLLSKPIIYISYFLKKNQIEYYDRISEVRRTGNYEQWIAFFLEAVAAAADDSITTIEALSSLHDKNTNLIPKSKRAKDNVKSVFDYVEQYPIIDIKRTAKALGLSFNTVSSAVRKLVELGILRETTNAARNRVFAYEEYLNIIRKDTE